MDNARKLWLDADLDLRQKFQKAIFPEGLVLNTNTLGFGTLNISPLYRYAPNKKNPSETEESLVVSATSQMWNTLEEDLFKLYTQLVELGIWYHEGNIHPLDFEFSFNSISD